MMEAIVEQTSAYIFRTRKLGFRHWHSDDFEIAARLWGDLKVTKFIDSRCQLSKKSRTREIKDKRNQGNS